MKKLLFILIVLAATVACKDKKETEETVAEEVQEKAETAYASFGEEISPNEAISLAEAAERYKNLKVGDTVPLKFTSKVKEVCQNKGCWMKLDLGEEETMVKFKDYGFFMPKDLTGEVIVEGVAFVDEMSVEDQRHYAEDAGKTPEEIAAITEPKRTLSFISHGVLVPEKQ